MRIVLSLLVAVIMIPADTKAQDSHLEIAKRVLSTVPLFDGHNDLPWTIRESEAAPRDVRAYDRFLKVLEQVHP